jgi:uncharacterized membrane protein
MIETRHAGRVNMVFLWLLLIRSYILLIVSVGVWVDIQVSHFLISGFFVLRFGVEHNTRQAPLISILS